MPSSIWGGGCLISCRTAEMRNVIMGNLLRCYRDSNSVTNRSASRTQRKPALAAEQQQVRSFVLALSASHPTYSGTSLRDCKFYIGRPDLEEKRLKPEPDLSLNNFAILPSFMAISIGLSGSMLPLSMRFESSFSTSSCMHLLIGRAPYAGSKPAFAICSSTLSSQSR